MEYKALNNQLTDYMEKEELDKYLEPLIKHGARYKIKESKKEKGGCSQK